MDLPEFKKAFKIPPLPNIIGGIAVLLVSSTLLSSIIINRDRILSSPIFNYSPEILVLIISILAGGIAILSYLNQDQAKENIKKVREIYSDGAFFKAMEATLKEISSIKSMLSKVDFSENITNEDKEELLKAISASISINLNSEFLKTIEEKYSESIISDLKYKQILENFQSLTDRLEKEIFRLSRRASLNLFIGICTTSLAVFSLFATVYFKNLEISDWKSAFEYFVPRISITIFIEIFSFFFLKLYRTSLSDIKYYQNELTNIDFKILALKSALLMNDKKSIEKIIQEFIKVERNFILKKGETTVEIEAFKNSNQYDESFSGVVKNLLDKLNHNTVKVKPKKTKKAELDD